MESQSVYGIEIGSGTSSSSQARPSGHANVRDGSNGWDFSFFSSAFLSSINSTAGDTTCQSRSDGGADAVGHTNGVSLPTIAKSGIAPSSSASRELAKASPSMTISADHSASSNSQRPAASVASPLVTRTADSLNAVDTEYRLNLLEEDIKGIDALLKKQQILADSQVTLRVIADHLSSELDIANQNRQSLEAKASQLEAFFEQERKQRQAWLLIFKSALQKTLDHLSNSVEQSIAESSNLMKGRLDVAEDLLQKLTQKVDDVFGKETTGATTFASKPSTSSTALAVTTSALGAASATAATTTLESVPAAVDTAGKATAADIMNSLMELMNENRRLEQRNEELVNQRMMRRSAESSRSGSCGPSVTASPKTAASMRNAAAGRSPNPFDLNTGSRPRYPGQLPTVDER